MKTLQILCAGGHGKVVADVAELCGYERIVFIDRQWPDRTMNGRWPIVANTVIDDGSDVFCAAGDNALRKRLSAELDCARCPVLAHPSAVISPSVVIGGGSLVMPGVVVNADTRIGKAAILNTACSVDHDCTLADFVHISPGARLAGSTTVGCGTWIGIGAAVIHNITIGRDVVIAAGAAVISNVPDNLRVGGVPATPLS